MTSEGSVPEQLLRFIDANVESIDQLEILRVLGENPGRTWNACELARDCQIAEPNLRPNLAALEGRGLLQTQELGADALRIAGPSTPEAAAALGQLLQFYKERPVTLIKVIYARANDRLRAFADAFRLRKKD